MGMKVIIIGGVAGGASAAARLRRLREDIDITLYEKDDYISFANCGLPYYIGGTIDNRDKLFVQTPEAMTARFKVNVKVKSEVISIDKNKKQVKVKDLQTGEIYTDKYDYLILSPGAEPLIPNIPGVKSDRVFTLRNISDTDAIKSFIDMNKPNSAVVVGGGYIGIEMVENLHAQGIEVTIVELDKQILPPLDPEMANIVHEHIHQKGVNLILGDAVTSINEIPQTIQIILRSGRIISTDMILMSVGVSPNIKLAQEADITIGPRGGIQVNEYMETSDPSIYAVGDAIEVIDFVNGKNARIPLAGPANKQGRIAADNIAGGRTVYHGTQGTAIAKIFDMTVATTGNNEKQLKFQEIPYMASYTHSASHASYYPGASPMSIKLLFNNKGRILGAQVVGYEGVDKRIDVISTVMRLNGTIYDLKELELAYAPPYSSAKDPVNMAGYVAGNILDKTVSIIHWHEISDLDTQNTTILDVREPFERKVGFVPNSINIPLHKLRDRLSELPKDRPIIVYCRIGLRAYIAARILMQNGFTDVRNLSGGYTTYAAAYLEIENNISSASVQPTAEETEETPEIKQTRYLDGSGLEPSDLLLQVEQLVESMTANEILQVVTSDPGFVIDMNVWCKNTANPFLSARKDGEEFVIMIKKGTLKS